MVEPDASERLFAEAIACTERSGDLLIASLLHNNAGVRYLCLGDIAGARAHLEQAAAAAAAIGDRRHYLLVNLGWVARAEGDQADAAARFVAGLRRSGRNGERSGLAYATLGLACVAADTRDWQVASQLHGAADMFLDRTGGEAWQEPEASYRNDSLGQLRKCLGQDQFDSAYAAGKALSFGAAFNLALAVGPSS
jgi:tetratricopeptide (TPR) repeat protein